MKRNLKKTCANCGSEFTCGLYGCWCTDIQISDAQYAVIYEKFHDCLCASCLQQISSGKIELTQPSVD